MISGKTRGRAIIDFVGPYRLATAEAVRRVFRFDDQAEAEAALGQLVRAGLLVEHRGKEAIGGTLPTGRSPRRGPMSPASRPSGPGHSGNKPSGSISPPSVSAREGRGGGIGSRPKKSASSSASSRM